MREAKSVDDEFKGHCGVNIGGNRIVSLLDGSTKAMFHILYSKVSLNWRWVGRGAKVGMAWRQHWMDHVCVGLIYPLGTAHSQGCWVGSWMSLLVRKRRGLHTRRFGGDRGGAGMAQR